MTGVPPDWPLAETSSIVLSAPHRWHVQRMGDGPDLVLIHGAGASTHSWRHLMPMLARDFRVTAFDLPGQGFTAMGSRGRSSLPAMAEDIGRLLAQLGVSPHLLIGHSAGAALALEMGRYLTVPPAGIVAINGALENFKGAAGWLFPLIAKMLVLNPLTAVLMSMGASDTSVRNLIASTGTDLDAEGAALYQRLVSNRKHVEGTLAMMAQWSLDDLNRALPGLQVPSLFLHGAEDSAVPVAVARRAVAGMPDARLVVFEDVGHIAQEEAPARVFAEIESFAKALDTERAAPKAARQI